MAQDSNLTDYQSIWNGQQIDEAIGYILDGDIEEAKNTAVEAAASAEQSAESAAVSANTAQQYSGKPAKTQNGTWWIWNASTQQYVNSGSKSVLSIVKSYPSVEAMQADVGNMEDGDLVIIATASISDVDNSKLYVHNGTAWVFLSDLSGIEGVGIGNVTLTSGNHAPGTTDIYTITLTNGDTYQFTVYNGADGTGPDVYEQAVAKGYTGTEDEFYSMLAGGPWLPTSGGQMSGEIILPSGSSGIGGGLAHVTFGAGSDGEDILIETYHGGGKVFIDGTAVVTRSVRVGGTLTDSSPNDTLTTKQYVDDKVASAGGGGSVVIYGTCSTSSEVSTKVVSAPGVTLKTGAVIFVKFSQPNSALSPTLNVNGTGAKYIKKYGTTAPDTYMWQPDAIVGFVYDGTYWVMINGTTATTTYCGVTKLDNTPNSSYADRAATASVLKEVSQVANSAYSMAQAANPIVVQVQNSSGSWYVKCYPIMENVYSISFSVPEGRQTADYAIHPPTGYAFTGLYSSSGVSIYMRDATMTVTKIDGIIRDNDIIFYGTSATSGHEISGTFTLEVA